MHRVFQVPELLDLILGTLVRSDNRLCALRVSHPFFHSAASLLWRELYRTSDLLLLIPETESTRIASSVELIEFPCPLTNAHFKRLNVSAPFVNEITIDDECWLSHYPKHCYVNFARLDSILNCDVLIEYLSNKPLLPNLAKIQLRYRNHHACLNWLRVLLLPSVCSIHVNVRDWPLHTTFNMLQLVEHKSPALRDLVLQPWGFEAESIEKDTDPDSLPQRQSQTISRFAVLCCIRFLNVGIASLYPQSLLVLSHLPDLEELHASVADPPPLTYDISPSSTAFPSLRKLFLECVVCSSWLIDLCSLVPVFKNLKLLSIDMWLGGLRSLGLTNTGLTISYCGDNDLSPQVSPSRVVEEPLRQLPLEIFELDAACFEGGCQFLSSAWPEIVDLRVSGQYASLEDLVPFAQNLPKLRKLLLALDWTGSTIPRSNPSNILLPRHTTFTSLCMEPLKHIKRSRATSQRLAEYLYFLWPNVHCARSWWDTLYPNTHIYTMSLDAGDKPAHKKLSYLDSYIDGLRQ